MSVSVDKPSPAARKPASAKGDDDGQQASAGQERWYRRWYGRLKRLLAFLEKRKASAGDSEEPEARGHGKSAPASQEEVPPVPRRRLRGFLLMSAGALAAGSIGAGITYSRLSTIVQEQAAKLERQKQEIRALGLQEQAHALKLAEVTARLDAEHALRLKAESGDGAGAQPLAATNTAPLAAPQQQTAAGSRSPSPSRGSTFRPPAAPKVTDCNLSGGDADALKRCLDDFNRK